MKLQSRKPYTFTIITENKNTFLEAFINGTDHRYHDNLTTDGFKLNETADTNFSSRLLDDGPLCLSHTINT